MPDVVLPVLNEADALPAVLARLPSGYRAIVVDNGSIDGSGDVARSFGATVVMEPERGFGAACHRGLLTAESEVVCFMDCDGSLDAADLTLVAVPVIDGGADLVLGRRTAVDGAWPLHSRLANRWLSRRVNKVAGTKLGDIGPMRAARRKSLLALDLQDRRFGYSFEMVFKAGRSGWRIEEVAVPYSARVGKSKITGTLRGTMKAAADIGKVLR
jgi:glycosyltransferase involved in cell wall biosynthesis